jgi:mannose-6-phosphate isomerase-like protein (cupin superfamily)
MNPQENIKRNNYSVVEIGSSELWKGYTTTKVNSLPGMEIPGKFFLNDVLALTSMEISINYMPAGGKVPFLHKHKSHEEVYLFLKGQGQFLIDGEVVPIKEGTVIKVNPEAIRTWRNNSSEDLYYLVIQATAGTLTSPGTDDGIKTEGKPVWPA